MLGITKRIPLIVLSIWLILTGLFALADIGFAGADLILNGLAVVAGVLLLLQAEGEPGGIGMILLAIWLVGRGLLSLVDVDIQGIGVVLNVLAFAAGVLILIEEEE